MALGFIEASWVSSRDNNGLNYIEEGYVIGPFKVPQIKASTKMAGSLPSLLSVEDMKEGAASSQKALASNFALSIVLGLSL